MLPATPCDAVCGWRVLPVILSSVRGDMVAFDLDLPPTTWGWAHAMTMTEIDSETGRRGRVERRRDRRLGLSDLLAALTRALGDRADSFLLRGAFEETLRRLVPVRSVRLRDNTGRWNGRSD